MLSPKLQRKVLELWTLFWSSGMTNPLVSIEQITYLLFLKQLEALDIDRQKSGLRSIYGPRKDCQLRHHQDDGKSEKYVLPEGADLSKYCNGHETCRWSSYILKNPNYDHISQYVFPWLRVIDKTLIETGNSQQGFESIGSQMDDAYFQFPREKGMSLTEAVSRVEELFQGSIVRSANADLMGDIFEYLLSEIQTSGKNGQFRTPRHIIRLMIELLNPDVYEPIEDPAAGTAGFLINSLQFLLKKYTDPDSLLLEWDGTPHRADGALLLERIGQDEFERAFSRRFFTGYDNDRTMVRIGWMNMILHGIENPAIERRDTLGKGLPDAESGAYRYVMANPPFTGTIDKGDLHETRFPPKPGSTSEAITNKSELLFVWLMLDLLEVGGRAAVIVPEGVLFGSTGAHRELRRQLLFENRLEGVISLPAGVFQPYTGVKTSILVFQKYAELPANREPRTDGVWFYEIESDGYTMDAKRNDLPEPNDVWDVLAKWPDRVVDSRDYYQPRLRNVRWRVVDDECLKVFPELANEKGQALGIDERKTGLPADPQQATQIVVETQGPIIRDLYDAYIRSGTGEAKEAYAKAKSQAQKERAARGKLEARLSWLNRQFGDASKKLLEKADYSDRFGNKALSPVLDNVRELAMIAINDVLAGIDMEPTDASQGEILEVPTNGEGETPDAEGASSTANDANAWPNQVEAIVTEFAKLDGYEVKLRSFDVQRQAAALKQSKSWSAPTRAYARFDNLQWSRWDTRITYQGSHDEQGTVRAEYLAILRAEHNIFDADATVKKEFLHLLDPACIEANDLNLSAGRYKPFTLEAVDHDPPAQIIAELQEMEAEIQAGLAALLAMVENSA